MIAVNFIFMALGGLQMFSGSTSYSAGGLILFLLAPSVVFHVLGGILPGRIRLYCHKCDHSEYFKIPKPESDETTS